MAETWWSVERMIVEVSNKRRESPVIRTVLYSHTVMTDVLYTVSQKNASTLKRYSAKL